MGIPLEVAEYFKNGRRRISSFVPNNDFSITITFDNEETKLYNMKEELSGVMEVLKDINKFKEAFLDEIGNIAWDIDTNIDSCVAWNNRIDLCADSLYIYSKSI